jgi:RHS repeat-associated protein
LYALQDANWNTTALVNAGGTVQERYTYTPFGQVTFRDGSGSTLSSSAKDWVFLHQGGEKIAAGNFEFRNRVYSPSLGRWLSNDPLGFEAGDQNWYRAIGNNPGNGLDPSGLDEWWFWSDPLYFVPVGEQNLVWDIWKTYINPKRSQRYLESKIRTISDGPLTIGHGLDQSFYNEVQQVGPVMLDKVAGDAAEKAAGAIVIGAAGVAARNIYKARKLVKPPSINPKTRLPRKNGKWSEGSPGNGLWESNIPEVNAITGGKPIPFKNGRPLFSEWSKGQIEFKPGTLNGSLSDFNYVYDHIAKKKGLPSRNAAVDYLKEVGLSPHHLDKNTIELIPTQLHKNIPHIGSASDLRGGY